VGPPPYCPPQGGAARTRVREPPSSRREPPQSKCGGSVFSVDMIEAKPQTNVMTGADIVLSSLEREGVEVIFGYPGGANLPIYQVTRVEDLAPCIRKAFPLATTGRPGPVLVDVCKDVQQASGIFDYPDELTMPGYRPALEADLSAIGLVAGKLAEAERPVILVGHGVLLSGAEAELLELAEKTGIPVGTTLLGIGAFPTEHPLSLHMTGFMGTGWCLRAVQNADLLMMVGMRVDDRVTAKLDEWAPRAETFIHVDIDHSEMGKNVRPHIEVVADAKRALQALLPLAEPGPASRRTWLTQI